MKKQKWKALYIGFVLLFATANLTACGSGSRSDQTEKGEIGRVTSISETGITLEIFEMQERPGEDGEGKELPDGEKPEGTPPADAQKPEGAPPADGQRPDGDRQELPEDVQGGDAEQKNDTAPQGSGKPEDDMQKGETKTYKIDGDTKFYKQDGEEKKEIAVDELELGSMVSVEADGDTLTTVTVQEMRDRMGGNRENRESTSS